MHDAHAAHAARGGEYRAGRGRRRAARQGANPRFCRTKCAAWRWSRGGWLVLEYFCYLGRAKASKQAANRRWNDPMPRVVGIDHLVLSVGDFARSKAFYDKLLKFLVFKLKHRYGDMAGSSNDKTFFSISA